MRIRLAILALLALVLSFTRPACGQSAFTVSPAYLEQTFRVAGGETHQDREGNPFALGSESAQKVADVSSWAAVLAEGGWYAARAWGQREGRGRRMACSGAKSAASFGAVQALKHLVHRERPDGSDNLSFPSGHTSAAAVMQPDGWQGYLWPTLIGLGRMLADKHHATDVLAGFGIGTAIRFIPCGQPP